MNRKLVLINIINKTLHLKVFFWVVVWNIKHDSNKRCSIAIFKRVIIMLHLILITTTWFQSFCYQILITKKNKCQIFLSRSWLKFGENTGLFFLFSDTYAGWGQYITDYFGYAVNLEFKFKLNFDEEGGVKNRKKSQNSKNLT